MNRASIKYGCSEKINLLMLQLVQMKGKICLHPSRSLALQITIDANMNSRRLETS